MSSFQTGIGGEAWRFSPPVSYWALKNPQGGGASTFKVPTGLMEGDDWAGKEWKTPETGVVHAFHVCGVLSGENVRLPAWEARSRWY